MILFGLILFLVVGPIAFVFIQPYTPFMISPHPPPPGVSYPEWLEALDRLKAFYRMSVGSGIGGIGIFFIIFGTVYFLATTILEYNKKRRLAHRSKI
jgi:hypothetical protein